MNKEQKNIETCLPEDVLSEVANVPTDPQFVSLTDEALDPLKRQAAAQAGWDGYEKVVWTHKPYTFTSQVKQMKSNLILLLRRLWRYPFGRGITASSDAGSSAASADGSSTSAAGSSAASADGSSTSSAGSSAASAAAPIRSLADMWQHYITRLKGNPEYGIPSRLSSLTDLPDAPALLAYRDMSSGIRLGTNPMPDGMSLAQLLCSSAESSVTEIVDTNVGWTMNKAISGFPNLEKLELGCKEILTVYLSNQINFTLANTKKLYLPFVQSIKPGSGSHSLPAYNAIFNGSPLEEVDLSELESYTGRLFVGGSLPEELNLPKLTNAGTCIAQSCTGVKRIIAENVTTCTGYSYHPNLIQGCPDLEYAYIPNLSNYSVYGAGDGAGSLQDMPKLEHLVIGRAPFISSSPYVRYALDNCPSLVLLDIRGGLNVNLYLDHWSPTLDSSNLQQFLSNFKTYIAERLTEKGTGLTLTLSQEVRNAIQAAEDEYGIENIIITKKGWTISPAPN